MGLFKTDWLASESIFYNIKTKKVSKNINDVIDFSNIEFDPEGLGNYFDFGYSVFGQTPIKNVKFLEPNSIIEFDDNSINISNFEDPVESVINNQTDVNDILDILKYKINKWESSFEEDILIPTSGGYDSRLLNCFISDKKRIHAFTYGLSKNQAESSEVVIAKEFSKRFGIDWTQIELGKYHSFINDWNDVFGCSVHSHGMYQMEFYSKIVELGYKELPLLSGIIGDAWAGNVNIPNIDDIDDVNLLGYTHGMVADSSFLNFKNPKYLKKKYFRKNKTLFKNSKWRIVESMRMKIILLRYLIEVPSMLGFKPWSPFLDFDIAMGMLGLSDEQRRNRNWQKDFFSENVADVDSHGLKMDKVNVLNIKANVARPLRPLDVGLLSGIINKDYLRRINNDILRFNQRSFIDKVFDFLLRNPNINGLSSRIGAGVFYGKELEAYYAYLVIKPLEIVLQKSKSL